MRILAAIRDPEAVRAILECLDLPSRPPPNLPAAVREQDPVRNREICLRLTYFNIIVHRSILGDQPRTQLEPLIPVASPSAMSREGSRDFSWRSGGTSGGTRHPRTCCVDTVEALRAYSSMTNRLVFCLS